MFIYQQSAKKIFSDINSNNLHINISFEKKKQQPTTEYIFQHDYANWCLLICHLAHLHKLVLPTLHIHATTDELSLSGISSAAQPCTKPYYA